MNPAPFFKPWRARLAPRRRRLTQPLRHLRHCTLGQIENRFDACIPDTLFAKATEGANSRDRIYTQRRTFWCFLWQALNPGCACREVVRQLQALFQLLGAAGVSEEDGAYIRARKRLPVRAFKQALAATAQAAVKQSPSPDGLQGRRLKVVDGSTVTLPDTQANQKAYPQVDNQKAGCGFPLMRVVVLFCLASGAILAMLQGNLHTAELRLFHRLMAGLSRGDIVLGDCGFGNFVVMALLQALGVDFIGRSARRVDGRRGRRLGNNDWLLVWAKGAKASAYLTAAEWAELPPQMTVRAVRGRVAVQGFRVREVTLVSTLLDARAYPAEELLRAYLRRWRLEMCLDDLKTTLGMEMLRCQRPAMVKKELLMHLIAHNLIRWTMGEAAREHEVELERISFKGTLDGLRQFSQAMSQARSAGQRRQLWALLLKTLAADQVPERPGRREPRAVKRKRNKYPRLNQPRRQFRDHPKRHERRRRAKLRRSLM